MTVTLPSVQANPAAYPELIATALMLAPASGIAVGRPRYPAPERLRRQTLLVYHGRFSIVVPMARISRGTAPVRLAGSLRYQGCDDRHCFPPRTTPVVLGIATQ